MSAGMYAPIDGMEACDDCPLGSYCDHYELGNVTGVIAPEPCPPGHYCPSNTEYATQNPCPSGTYSNSTMLDAEGLLSIVCRSVLHIVFLRNYIF